VRIIQHGSGKSALQVEALAIFSICVSNRIHMEPEWVPQEQNQLADYYSRLVVFDDYSLNPAIFDYLNSIWGPYTIDRFASAHNAHLKRYNSRYGAPGSEAIDAFTCDWAGETTGGSHLYALSLELLGMPKTLKLLEHWWFPSGCQLLSGPSCFLMGGTLQNLLWTGWSCLQGRN